MLCSINPLTSEVIFSLLTTTRHHNSMLDRHSDDDPIRHRLFLRHHLHWSPILKIVTEALLRNHWSCHITQENLNIHFGENPNPKMSRNKTKDARGRRAKIDDGWWNCGVLRIQEEHKEESGRMRSLLDQPKQWKQVNIHMENTSQWILSKPFLYQDWIKLLTLISCIFRNTLRINTLTYQPYKLINQIKLSFSHSKNLTKSSSLEWWPENQISMAHIG